MKKTIEISASFTGKISVGQFENESPYFSLKEIIEVEDVSDDAVIARQKILHKYCYDQFKAHAELAYQEKIAKQYQNIRFYSAGEKKYPSVTSILDMDVEFSVSPEELAQYGARGTCIHKQAEIFLKTGEWKEIKDIPEVAFEYLTVIKGGLNLLVDDVNFQGFYKDYPFEVLNLEGEVINHELQYGGRYDIKAVISSKNKGKWDKVEGIKFDESILLDIKTGTVDKTKCFTQLSAYALTQPDVKQVGIVHLNNEVQAGYSKPVVTANLERYTEIFKKQRENFRKRYGL